MLGSNKIQELYFEGHSKGRIHLTTNILVYVAYKAKNRVKIQNALRQLYASTHASCNKFGWLTQNIVEYEDKEVLDELTKDGTQIFHKKWAFISSNTYFDSTQLSSYLILQLVVNHLNDIKLVELDYFAMANCSWRQWRKLKLRILICQNNEQWI